LLSLTTSRHELTRSRFIVYAASAIYIIGIPGVMVEYNVSEQEALLGLSLYVLACKFGIGAGFRGII
jgi:hypothetical protein